MSSCCRPRADITGVATLAHWHAVVALHRHSNCGPARGAVSPGGLPAEERCPRGPRSARDKDLLREDYGVSQDWG